MPVVSQIFLIALDDKFKFCFLLFLGDSICSHADSSPVAWRAARSGRVEAHGKGERRKFSDWQITVIFLAKKCFSCKLIFYASILDFLTLVYINRSFYDVVSAKCVFLSSISALNWSSLEYFKMADSDELRW